MSLLIVDSMKSARKVWTHDLGKNPLEEMEYPS